MSRVLVIPDSHLKIEVIEKGIKLANKHFADKIILLGDYFDDFGAIDEDYYRMLDYLKKLLRSNPNVFPLFGNHELSYLGYPCSGHNSRVKDEIEKYLRENYRFSTSIAVDGILYSHAGATMSWLRDNHILTENELRYKLGKTAGAETIDNGISHLDMNRSRLEVFAQAGRARGGKSDTPSVLWADISELVSDQVPKVKQVVGHTPVTNITLLGNCWFVDVFSSGNVSDEYLYVNDGVPEVLHYDEEFGY